MGQCRLQEGGHDVDGTTRSRASRKVIALDRDVHSANNGMTTESRESHVSPQDRGVRE
jgi:hypothetical protein